MSDSATPWTAALQASLSFTISQSLLKLMPIESVMPSNHLVLCHLLLLLPSIFPSIRGFSTIKRIKKKMVEIAWKLQEGRDRALAHCSDPPGQLSGNTCWPTQRERRQERGGRKGSSRKVGGREAWMQRAVWGTQDVEVTGDGAGTVETRLRAAKHSVHQVRG